MTNIQPIMVNVGSPRWTMAAMHMACALARQNGNEVALLKLLETSNVQWLGTSLGGRSLTAAEYQAIDSYYLTAQDYNVSAVLYKMQYMFLREAIVSAANDLDAKIVFATLPSSRFTFWHNFQLWRLQQQLTSQGRQLYTLEKSRRSTNANWAPSVLVTAAAENRSNYAVADLDTMLGTQALDDRPQQSRL